MPRHANLIACIKMYFAYLFTYIYIFFMPANTLLAAALQSRGLGKLFSVPSQCWLLNF